MGVNPSSVTVLRTSLACIVGDVFVSKMVAILDVSSVLQASANAAITNNHGKNVEYCQDDTTYILQCSCLPSRILSYVNIIIIILPDKTESYTFSLLSERKC